MSSKLDEETLLAKRRVWPRLFLTHDPTISILRRRLGVWGFIFFCAVLDGTLLMLFARLHWIPELAAHFVPLYALGAFAATILLAIGRHRRWAVFSLFLFAVHATLLVPYLPRTIPRTNAPAQLRLLIANVLTENTDHVRFLDYALASDADIIGVQEVNNRWVEQLAPLEEKYPYAIKVPRPDNFGIALYSRVPIDDLRVEYLQPHNLETIAGMMEVDGRPVHLRVIHTLPPIGATYAGARDKQLASIGAWARANAPCILIGDFNTSMWSPHYRDMLRDGRLTNARRRHGILGTWPARLYPLSIPIDHCLFSPQLQAITCRRGPNIGSDHFPLLVDLTSTR